MFREEFALGGPVMYALFAVWVVMLALILDRALFWLGRALRRPRAARAPAPAPVAPGGGGAVPALAAPARGEAAPAAGSPDPAVARVEEAAGRNLWRIDALSQIATSLGLFGTVIGIAQSFFARGAELSLAAPAVLAGGLATALFTTVGGLGIFLCGQGALLVFYWLTEREVRRVKALRR